MDQNVAARFRRSTLPKGAGNSTPVSSSCWGSVDAERITFDVEDLCELDVELGGTKALLLCTKRLHRTVSKVMESNLMAYCHKADWKLCRQQRRILAKKMIRLT